MAHDWTQKTSACLVRFSVNQFPVYTQHKFSFSVLTKLLLEGSSVYLVWKCQSFGTVWVWRKTVLFYQTTRMRQLLTHSGQSVFLWAIYLLFLTYVVTSSCFGLTFSRGDEQNVVVISGGSRISQTGVPTPEFGAKAYYLEKFGQKLHENEEIGSRGGIPTTPSWIRHWSWIYANL